MTRTEKRSERKMAKRGWHPAFDATEVTKCYRKKLDEQNA